jgi:RND family efflux transporter MFP subunit
MSSPFHRILVSALVLSCALPVAPSLAAQAAPAAPSVLAIPAVTLARAEQRELIDALTVSGTLVPREEVLVPAEIDGLRVTELLADEGDTVSEGQVLARLSRDTLEAQLAQNDAAIRKAEASMAQASNQIPQAEAAQVETQGALQRTEALRQSGNSTIELLEQRTAAARTAVARLAAARDGYSVAQAERAAADAQRRELMVKLGRTEIKSPVAGLISRRTAKVGSVTALNGEPMFRLIANGKVELEAEVMETSLTKIPQGAPASLALNGGRTLVGSVRLLPAEVDRISRLGKVRIALPADPAFRVGAFARAQVVLAQRNGIAVPSSAVAYGAAGATVQVVKDDKVEVRPVTPGISAGGMTEIVNGLSAGEQVVAKAMAFLRNGDSVRPIVASAGAQ